MTEKVKVSPEVAIALKDLFSRSEINYPKNEILEMHYKALNGGDRWSGGTWEHLNKLSMSEMAQAMFVGYEEKPQFEVGDWVVYTHDNTLWKVIGELYGGKVHYEITRNGKTKGSIHKDHIRLATKEEVKAEQERQLWKSIGREVGEFKIGDIGICRHNNTYRDKPQMLESLYKDGKLKFFYPVESYIKF